MKRHACPEERFFKGKGNKDDGVRRRVHGTEQPGRAAEFEQEMA